MADTICTYLRQNELNANIILSRLDDIRVDDVGFQENYSEQHHESEEVDVRGMVIVRLPWELDEADSVRVESVKNPTKTVVSILGSQFFSVVCIFSS